MPAPKRKKRKENGYGPVGSFSIPGKNGTMLRNGGTNKGGPGRPPKAFKQFCSDLTKDPDYQAKLEATAKNPKSSHYMGAVKLVTEYSEGKPAQAIALSGEVTFNAAEIRQQIADRLARRAVKGRTG